MGLEHQVEAARRRQRSAIVGAFQAQALDHALVAEVGGGQAFGTGQLVQPVAAVAGPAFDERVAERADVAGRDPHLGVHEDARIESHDVVALLDHGPPPGALDVVLQLDTQRAVVPDGVDAAVDLAAGEDETAPLGERHDGVQGRDGGRDVVVWGRNGKSHETSGLGAGRGRDGRGVAVRMLATDGVLRQPLTPPLRHRGDDRHLAARHVATARTSSRKASERASRSRTWRRKSRIAASTSRSTGTATRSAASASTSSRW